ncbi:dihydrofolate reductase family protein [Euzebya sp.]|uniref:dihydrofolate reductase family protein n=1 Tax=Euzebya sp. TaxID=1971409 RepID=UPI003518BEAD
MPTITTFLSTTLDGVVQAPGRPDEDRRGGFAHGGWAAGYADEVSMAFAGEGMARGGPLLLGRRTYEDLLGFWTTTPEPNPFTDVLVAAPKLVVSRSARTALGYPNSTLLAGEATSSVAALGDEVGDLTVLGSIELVTALEAAGLVDTHILSIHPIVLGSGRRLFTGTVRRDLRLQRSITTTTGVIIAVYGRI